MNIIVHRQQRVKSLDQEAGADEKDERQCYFGDDQGATETMASAASRGAAAAFLESFADIRARDEQRGSDAGEQTAGDSNGQGEAERADVQANGVPAGNKFGHI